jgi:hypothetical protein
MSKFALFSACGIAVLELIMCAPVVAVTAFLQIALGISDRRITCATSVAVAAWGRSSSAASTGWRLFTLDTQAHFAATSTSIVARG